MDYRRLIALCMVLAYLLLPMDGLAQFQPFAPPVEKPVNVATPEVAKDHCPDSPCGDEGHGPGQCDASCSCCSCFAPLPQGFVFTFSPVITTMVLIESFRALPLVCLPIFVPPQNRS